MTHPVTLFTGQWADLPLEALCAKVRAFGYDGLELACWGDHFDVHRALSEPQYVARHWQLLQDHGLGCWAVSNHLVGQAVCDPVDDRHRGILPDRLWGDGDPEAVRQRAAAEMKDTARAARRFFDAAPPAIKEQLAAMGRTVVNGFTGSSIWAFHYPFPPLPAGRVQAGYDDFAARWLPILETFAQENVHFALEVHPAEIAFDLTSATRALHSVREHPQFGFNFDPSHFGYQGADYLRFLRELGRRVYHVHVKDVWWSATPTDAGVFGGHAEFGDPARYWDFRSPGHGRIDFDAVFRGLLLAGYQGPLSVEWEDPHMDREHGAAEAVGFVRRLQFPRAGGMFDSAFVRG